jgi:hypothetical protein
MFTVKLEQIEERTEQRGGLEEKRKPKVKNIKQKKIKNTKQKYAQNRAR